VVRCPGNHELWTHPADPVQLRGEHRNQAGAVVYGHLHIPRTTWHDGVRFEEVSLGYPGEWQRRPSLPYAPRQVLP
jgi:hypothetical protein